MKNIFLFLLLFLISGCVATIDPNDSVSVASNISVTNDKHVGSQNLIGPASKLPKDSDGSTFVLATEKKGNSKKTILVINMSYWGDWRLYKNAYYKGNKLETKTINSDIGPCSRLRCLKEENIAIKIPSNILSDFAKDKNVEIKLFARTSSKVISIPNGYISAFYNEYRKF